MDDEPVFANEGETFHTLTLDLPPDDRTAYERCAICLRTLHPQRKVPLGDEWACGLCASIYRPEELVLRHWLAEHPEVRRHRLTMNFGIDPATRSVALAEVEFTTFTEDVDGMPSTLEVTHHRGRILYVGIPECYWSVAQKRGQL